MEVFTILNLKYHGHVSMTLILMLFLHSIQSFSFINASENFNTRIEIKSTHQDSNIPSDWVRTRNMLHTSSNSRNLRSSKVKTTAPKEYAKRFDRGNTFVNAKDIILEGDLKPAKVVLPVKKLFGPIADGGLRKKQTSKLNTLSVDVKESVNLSSFPSSPPSPSPISIINFNNPSSDTAPNIGGSGKSSSLNLSTSPSLAPSLLATLFQTETSPSINVQAESNEESNNSNVLPFKEHTTEEPTISIPISPFTIYFSFQTLETSDHVFEIESFYDITKIYLSSKFNDYFPKQFQFLGLSLDMEAYGSDNLRRRRLQSEDEAQDVMNPSYINDKNASMNIISGNDEIIYICHFQGEVEFLESAHSNIVMGIGDFDYLIPEAFQGEDESKLFLQLLQDDLNIDIQTFHVFLTNEDQDTNSQDELVLSSTGRTYYVKNSFIIAASIVATVALFIYVAVVYKMIQTKRQRQSIWKYDSKRETTTMDVTHAPTYTSEESETTLEINSSELRATKAALMLSIRKVGELNEDNGNDHCTAEKDDNDYYERSKTKENICITNYDVQINALVRKAKQDAQTSHALTKNSSCPDSLSISSSDGPEFDISNVDVSEDLIETNNVVYTRDILSELDINSQRELGER